MNGQGRKEQFPSPSTSSSSSNITNSNVIPSPSLSSVHNLLHSTTTTSTQLVNNNNGMFMQVVKDLPTSLGFFGLGTEKTKPSYPLLPEIVLRIVNCDRLIEKCRDEDATCFLSCHIAATKRSDPTCNDIFTFSEFPLNTNIKLSDLMTQSYSPELGGCTQAFFKPKGFVLNLHDTSVYSKFTIKFQLIMDHKNASKLLIDQVNTNSFESALMSLTMKEDFDENTKYIIGSLANRSDELIKHGSKKIAAPVTIKFSPTLLDHFVKNMKKELYVHFYIRGEDGDDKDISYCLMKHDRIKIKPNVYTYQLDKNLGRLDNGEKKPQKDRFRLGIVLCTKFLALPSNKFTKRMLKYKYPNQTKTDPSLLYWIETKPFQSAKRQDICKPKRKAPEEHSDEEVSNESHSTHLTTPPQQLPPQISPKLVTDLKEILSARILNQMYEKDPQKSALLEDFIQQSQLLLQVYNQLHNSTSGSISIISYKFDRIYPTEGNEGTPIAVLSSKELHQDAKFIVTFGNTKLSYSGGITSKHSIGFTVPPKPVATQNSYVVKVAARDAYVQVEPSSTEMIFTYAEDKMIHEASITTQVQQGSMMDLLNSCAGNQIQTSSPFDDEFLVDDLNDCFTGGDFDGIVEYFEHNSVVDLVTERDRINNRLPIENSIQSGQLQLVEKIVPILYEYWLDEIQNLTFIAKELLTSFRTEKEISINLEKASSGLSKLAIGEHQEVEENIVASSPTYPSSPSIIVSSSPNNSETKDSSKLFAGKINRKSSFRDMITKLFTVDSNIASGETSDDIKDIMTEIATSPKHGVLSKFETSASTLILQATEEPAYKNPDLLNNLSNLKNKLERFENEVDPKGIDTIVTTLGDSSSILSSYFLKESNLSKLTVQMILHQENLKKISKSSSTNKSDFEEIFQSFDLSIQLNEKTSVTWDSARGIAKIVSKPNMNRLFAVFDILTLEGKPKVSNFIQKLSMTIAYWNVNQHPESTCQQFVESILLETGYISSCKSLFESFSSMVLGGSKSHDKIIRRKIKLPKELTKGFSKKKWKFQSIKDAAEFNESLNHFSSSEETETLATDLAKLAHGFERALLWNHQQ